MKIKKGGGKYLFLALITGSIAGVICLSLNAPQVVSNAIPMGVSAAIFFSFRDKWLDR